jgi:cytochrome d ubiquinol oxidase subunit I
MEAEFLARIQFAVTAGFHFLYPPISIGLGLIMVIMEGIYLKTKNPLYSQMARFWTKVFALIFAVGVATGIVMEFQFGTNWATYSRSVGDIFGSPLAAEALFAFFMESIFLGILIFGWNRVSPKMHFFSTIMVALGATLSAFWIIVANSWMHTPSGYIFNEAAGRAEIVDFWAMVFNPSTLDRYLHVISASWLTGAFFVLSISGYYLFKNKHIDFAKASLKIALILAVFASLFQLFTGHQSAVGVAKNQPAKLAAFEGQYETGVGDLYLLGWVNEEKKETIGIKIPGFLSFLVYFDFTTPITGLDDIKEIKIDSLPKVNQTVTEPIKPYPPVNFVFQSYHIMVALGMLMILISLVGLILLLTKKIHNSKWFLGLLIPSFILPHISNLVGWIAAEVGRQPWAIQGILLTKAAASKVVDSGQVLFSLILFTTIYTILLILFIILLIKKIKHGPEDVISMEPSKL